MQVTKHLKTFDGTEIKAIVSTEKRQFGHCGRITINGISKIVTSVHPDPIDAFDCACRVLRNHRENSII